MSEENSIYYNRAGTPEGDIVFGEPVNKNNSSKMAVLIRRIFPGQRGRFKRDHYIGLQMAGELDGAILNSAPSVYGIYCGEKAYPSNSTPGAVAGMWYAENGDIVLAAPNGRIRLLAEGIDVIANGNPGEGRGFINIMSNNSIVASAENIDVNGADYVGVSCDREIEVTGTADCNFNVGSFSVVEGADVSPITSPPIKGTGSLSILRQYEGLLKLINSLT